MHLSANNRKQEGNVLFNDAFNTFYLWLYVIRHMIKGYSYNERGNLLTQLHGLFFYMHHPTDRTVYTSLYYTSRGALDGMRNSSIEQT